MWTLCSYILSCWTVPRMLQGAFANSKIEGCFELLESPIIMSMVCTGS